MVQEPHWRGEHQQRHARKHWMSELEASSETTEASLLSLQMTKARRFQLLCFLARLLREVEKHDPMSVPEDLSFAHHWPVGTTRPDLPGMRFWNQCRSNNCPSLSRQWASKTSVTSWEGKKGGRLGLCRDPQWGGTLEGVLVWWCGLCGLTPTSSAPVERRRGGREGGKEKGVMPNYKSQSKRRAGALGAFLKMPQEVALCGLRWDEVRPVTWVTLTWRSGQGQVKSWRAGQGEGLLEHVGTSRTQRQEIDPMGWRAKDTAEVLGKGMEGPELRFSSFFP